MNKKNQKLIYLDHAATTYLDQTVQKRLKPFERKDYGNPNSMHSAGRRALAAVDCARKQVANFLSCAFQEVVFTSGATESNNLAIRGVIKAYQERGVRRPEIITTKIEHRSVLKTCLDLEKEGIGLKYLPVNSDGMVDPRLLLKLISDSTALVTIMYANNEIGVIEPIRELGKIIKKANGLRKRPIVFHTDAVQAAQYLDCDIDYLQVDLLSLSGHKLHGPKGIGALFVRRGTPIKPVQTGGDQEHGLRAGTLNVAGIIGLGKALELVFESRLENSKKVSRLRDWVIKEISNIPEAKIIGPIQDKRLPNNIYFRIKGILGEDLVFIMDNKFNIAIATGSSCSAGAAEPSTVLLALGLDGRKAKEGIRVTLDQSNTLAELRFFIKALKKTVKEISLD
ncbi:MAG: cysteine desulfurase NifS [Candidatus Kerfeldbacteria bacterium CG_4_10_14_0_8_um_filter_42_10]|uniref:cysteine desulfurase n=1 Tax=Candidatus Kerfeldbacteria bacterium CG_4_10_14_0_8_um_filter_42_10 TaxID=2014248 RepID=A0A2M7RLF3_9BACT|nr:MAG: cysteine desulfurase NifS [Candidatus Kerfeldbacteria bacterium CG_4_10_14_0_8_um_filter_42_10]